MARSAADPLRAALKALARRELSAAELVERLTRLGISADDAAHAVDTLREAGYQSDERTASERARVLSDRGLGDAAIKADLQRRRIKVDIDLVIAGLPPEHARAERLAGRIGHRRRLAQTLLRKGYSEDTIIAFTGAHVADPL